MKHLLKIIILILGIITFIEIILYANYYFKFNFRRDYYKIACIRPVCECKGITLPADLYLGIKEIKPTLRLF